MFVSARGQTCPRSIKRSPVGATQAMKRADDSMPDCGRKAGPLVGVESRARQRAVATGSIEQRHGRETVAGLFYSAIRRWRPDACPDTFRLSGASMPELRFAVSRPRGAAWCRGLRLET